MADTVLLVDAFSLIYRAFYAIRSLTGPDGEPVNALYGFTKMLRKLLADFQPSHAAVVFDRGAPAQRLALLPSYKEHRPPTPPALEAQLPAIREMLAALRVPLVELEGEEADDIIATLATQATQAGVQVFIASNDKDFSQIVGPSVRLIRPDGGQAAVMDAAAVAAHYGVKPEQMAALLSLVGDPVDNIPGVPGVGAKTAVGLLDKYGDLDNLLAHVAEIPQPKLRQALADHRDRVRLNRQLITLQTALALPVQLDALKRQSPDEAKLLALFRRFGFKRLAAELEPKTARADDLFPNT